MPLEKMIYALSKELLRTVLFSCLLFLHTVFIVLAFSITN